MAFSFNQKELGKRIRDERLKNKLTIERLCELLDVSPSFIGLVERGTSGISLEKLCRLRSIKEGNFSNCAQPTAACISVAFRL